MRGRILRELVILFGRLDRQILSAGWNQEVVRSLLGEVHRRLHAVDRDAPGAATQDTTELGLSLSRVRLTHELTRL